MNLTDDQFGRFNILAKLLVSTPEHVAIGLAFEHLEGFRGCEWGDHDHGLHCSIEFYAEKRRASEGPRSERFEYSAPARMRRLAGVKEVQHA